MKAWFTCSSDELAAQNDLDLQKNPVSYHKVDANVSRVASNTLSRHLWYLSPSLVRLALFNSRVPTEKRAGIVAALLNETSDSPEPRVTIKDRQ